MRLVDQRPELIDLEEILRAVELATPGPWRAVSPWEDGIEAAGNLDRPVETWQVEAAEGLLIADCWQAGKAEPAEQGEPDATLIALCNPETMKRIVEAIQAAAIANRKFQELLRVVEEKGCVPEARLTSDHLAIKLKAFVDEAAAL